MKKSTIWYKEGIWTLEGQKFEDPQQMVDYANENEITISNKEMLHEVHQHQLIL